MADHARVLIVDDQLDFLASLQLTLESAGYQIVMTSDANSVLTILQSQPIDLIISDIAMPSLNGYQLYQRVRDNPDWVMIPFLLLTARTMDSDVRYGKELGVDDYLTKPIQPEDLLAAVSGKLQRAQQLRAHRRHADAPAHTHSRTLGRITIDAQQHRVWLDGRLVHLAAREFLVLDYLASHVEQVVPAHELIQITHKLHTDDVEAGTLLRPLIRSVRRKLGYAVGEAGCIENVRGLGYRLTMPK